MSWLRIDDGFTSNAKVSQLTDREFRVWMRLLCHCARNRDPHVTAGTANEVVGLSRKLVQTYGELGLLDETDEGVEVHDWRLYQPKDADAANRMRRNRDADPRPVTNKWARARDEVFDRDRGVCVDCGKDCTNGDGSDGRDLWNADHEPPRKQLQAAGISIYDTAYIFTRCHSCHSKKTRSQTTEPSANHDRTAAEP